MKMDSRNDGRNAALNTQARQRAIEALDRAMRDAEKAGKPGSVSVRIPYQRGKFGNVRVIREFEA